MKKILVILGNPSLNSLGRRIADSYLEGAKNNFDVKKLYLPELKFDPILHEGYSKGQKLEEDLKKSQELITWANHIILIYPIWWTSFPALLKGFIDRVFLPGFAFKYEKGGKVKRLLKGKTATLIMTAGGSKWWYMSFGRIMNRAMTIGILHFSGIKCKKQTFICEVRKLSKERYGKIIDNAKSWGQKGL